MIGQTIKHYKVLEKLGEGAMGVVYKAHDLKLNRHVALKFLHSFYTKDESSRKRFIVEAQAASSLEDPNICNIHEINETEDGQLYISMAYYEGESLRNKIKKGPIPFDETINIIFQIAKGLSAAHLKGIVHRDIKPANIIITDKGEVKIVDFGLAKLDGGKLTHSLSTKGTIAYMSPAAIRDLPIDHREDIWAIGILLFEMLTGQLPFEGSYAEPMMYSIVNEKPKQLSQYLDDAPEKIQKIVEKLLQKEKKDAYKDISELLIDLQPLMNESITIKVKTQPTILKNKPIVYIGSAILIMLLFLILGRPLLFPETIKENKIAVLPLANISNEGEEAWLTEGMTDALITELAQISGLSVISRYSSMQYKGTTKLPPDIAKELGVDYLIDGSILRMGDFIKISARIINAQKNDYIWAKEYERDFKNILELQAEIATTIASQIKVELTPREASLFEQQRTINPETYEMYMKGMYHLNKLTPSGIEKGLSYLEQSVENNPNEPLAHAGLAIAYLTIAHGASYTPDILSYAKTATESALELDNKLPEAQLALAMVQAFGEMDWMSAMKSNERALELNPNLALAHYMYGYLNRIPGRFEKGYSEMKKAKQLDPLNPVYPADLGWMYYGEGKYEESIEECLESLELNPGFPQAYFTLGQSYAAKGLFEKAIDANKKACDLSFAWQWGLAHTYAVAGQIDSSLTIIHEIEKRNLDWDTWCLAAVYAALGDAEKLFYWLEKAYDKHHPFIQWIGKSNSMYFGKFHGDPRFADLMQRLNLPD